MLMEESTKQKSKTEAIPIKLPRPRFGLLNHLDNIIHSIAELENLSGVENNLVIGYNILRSAMGTKYTNYRILPLDNAKLRKDNSCFGYYTLKDLLEEKKAYEKGKYKVREKHFIGLNPDYTL